MIPSTCECILSIRCTSVVPERGNPTRAITEQVFADRNIPIVRNTERVNRDVVA